MTRTVQEINCEIARLRKARRRAQLRHLLDVPAERLPSLHLIWRDFPWGDHPATGLAILMAGVEATPYPDFDSDAAFAIINAAIARVRRNLAMGGRS